MFPRFQTVQYLLHPFETEKRAAQHQQWRNRPGDEGADQQSQWHEDHFVNERPFRHSPDHGQLAIRPHAGNLLGIERQIVAQHPAVFSPLPCPSRKYRPAAWRYHQVMLKTTSCQNDFPSLFINVSLEYALKTAGAQGTISQYKFNNLTQINHSPAR